LQAGQGIEHCLRHKLFPANAWMKFFHCTLRPIGTVAGSINRSDEDIPLDLIFFSPFDRLCSAVVIALRFGTQGFFLQPF
jgi:hypothetical protein